MARPSVWRAEFQQDEKEYIFRLAAGIRPLKNAGRVRYASDTPGGEKFNSLFVSVARGQHGGEPGYFFLAAAAFARLFELPTAAHDFERAFTVDFLLQSPQRTFHWFAFFQFNFSQCTHFLSWGGSNNRAATVPAKNGKLRLDFLRGKSIT
jgi:hypothetical protein